jgi:hypothetical protein
MKYFNPYAFFLAFLVGLVYVYLDKPRVDLVYTYPTPDNIDKVTYTDEAGVCYKFKMKEVECFGNVKTVKIQ